MIEKYTIDSLADEIESQFKGAEPEKKLLRKFFREGKRHGRKGIASEPMQNFLENAIELATSKIAEDFVEEEKAGEAALAGMRARQTMLEEDLADDGEAVPRDGSDDATSGDGHDTGAGSGLGTSTGGPDLSAALNRMKAERAAREAAGRAAQREAERKQAEQTLDGIEEQIAVLEEKLEDLPEKYQQLVESCHETGELMWSRYCQGYVLGQSKRGVADSDDQGPDPDIEFEYPEVLDQDDEDDAPAGRHAAGAKTRTEEG